MSKTIDRYLKLDDGYSVSRLLFLTVGYWEYFKLHDGFILIVFPGKLTYIEECFSGTSYVIYFPVD